MKPVRKSTGSAAAFANNHQRFNSGPSSSLSVPAAPLNSHDNPRARLKRPAVSPPTTIELEGVPIHFPFKPYKCQEEYMKVVLTALLRSENALLESPTGTGKTLCLLCATLAWQREQARMVKSQADFGVSTAIGSSQPEQQQTKQCRRVPTIIYASRTHSQLSQVVRELRNTRYRPKHAVLGSREQMCVNPKVKKTTSTASTINHDCSILNKERKCNFRNRLEGFSAPSNESSSGAWYGTQPVMDMEDLVLMGNTHKVCPFYYTRNSVEEAELILVPYNYLFDKDSRTTTLADIPWDNSVLIFDEAHNLESFASESASFDLSSKDIAGCMYEVDRAITYVESDPDRFSGHIKQSNLLRLKNVFMKMEDYIITKLDARNTSYLGEKMMNIFEVGAGINFGNYQLLLDEIRKLFDLFFDIKGGTSKGVPRLEHFVQCVKRVFGESTEARCLAKAQSYRVYVTPSQSGTSNSYGGKDNNAGRTISYWCFAPSEAMRELADLKVRSIIVTSGTLSPLESYAVELGLTFPNRLENPHIIADHQIHVRVIGKGVSQKLLTSSYERRQDAEYYIELGNTLASLSRTIPGGMLVFFPSYGVMETAIERWGGPVGSRPSKQNNGVSSFFERRQRKISGSGNNTSRYSFPQQAISTSSFQTQSTPWRRLLMHKAIVVEPKSSSDLPGAIEEFHKFLGMPKSKGVALFGVCRGKISEGIDFAHEMCRAVIITGLPFAPSFDPKVKMKREFLDNNRAKQSARVSTNGGFGALQQKAIPSLSGHEWYTQQAHRAVNQAVGRVIRNKQDYGAVLLMDSRFALPGNQNGLSKWIRPHILHDEGFGRANHALVQFYNKAKQMEQTQPEPLPEKPTNVSLILQYETDGKENNQAEDDEECKKVAVIGRSGEVLDTSDGLEKAKLDNSPSRSYIHPQRIIARLDVTTSEGSKMASQVLKNEARKQEVMSSLSMSSTQSSNPSQPDLGQSENQKMDEKVKPAPSPAKQFFQKVQSIMTQEEFDTIKKAVVLMKKFSQQKYRREFNGAVSNVIQIILDHDDFRNRGRKEKPELLMLLLQLLPKHFLKDGEQCFVNLLFRKTSLRQELNNDLSAEEYIKIHRSFLLVLWEIWFESDDSDDHDCIQKLGKLLRPMVEKKNVSSSAIFQFSEIIPTELTRIFLAFVDQLIASAHVARIKAGEKSRMGENVIWMERFRKIYPVNLCDGQNMQNTEDVVAQCTTPVNQSSERACNSATKSSDIFTSRQNQDSVESKATSNPYTTKNPYAKRPSIGSNSNNGRRHHLDPHTTTESKKRTLNGSRENDTSTGATLKKILRQSASEMFTGNTSTKTVKYSPNAPKNLTCIICQHRMERPYISECCHMACLNCWKLWFEKQETCPQCRRPASCESIALAIFRDK